MSFKPVHFPHQVIAHPYLAFHGTATATTTITTRDGEEESASSIIPDEYLCPITHQLMRDPVIASDGYSYERTAIEQWLDSFSTSAATITASTTTAARGPTSPMTNQPLLLPVTLTPNRSLKLLIRRFTDSQT